MPRTLAPETVTIVKSTAPLLVAHGVEITTRMYERLFVDPAIKALFDQAAQPRASSRVAWPRRSSLSLRTSTISPRSARRSSAWPAATSKPRFLPEHYPAVANALLPAIRDVLGSVASDEVLHAWAEAFWLLADVLIARETSLTAEPA